jgi:hypothetical protein
MPDGYISTKIDLRRIPWTAVVTATGLGISGVLAWDDLGDSLDAQAQALDQHIEAEADVILNIWEELEDLSESVDASEEDIQIVQRRLLEITGEQRQTVAEIKGDVKLILRLLEERQ